MVAAWNYDGDLDVDLAVAIRNYPATIEILENDGAGAFTPGPEISIPMYLSYLTVVDLEGDGDEDLLAHVRNVDDAQPANGIVVMHYDKMLAYER